MLLNQLIALILPAIISVKVYEKLDDVAVGTKVLLRYLKAMFIINILMYLILIYLIKQVNFIFTNQFTLKYMLLSAVIALIYPFIEKVIKVNIGCDIEVESKVEK